jgi:hypothetical protein
LTEQTPCGCCAGITAQTPATIDNRAGLSAIAYRSGTWAQFKTSMLDALSTTPALAGLATRSDDDFTIALLDSWAVICDILTFYTERIANESYLRTATELVSVGELAKLIGYKLRPGLAASTALSFTMDTPLLTPPGPSNPPSGSPTSIALGPGTQAQTVPDPGAQPATFETIAPICARAGWNAIGPRLTMPCAPVMADAGADAEGSVRLASLATTVKVGDWMLVVAAGTQISPQLPQLQQVASVEPDTTTKTTTIDFGLNAPLQSAASLPATQGTAAAGASLNDTFLWYSVKGVVWPDQSQLTAFGTAQGWSIDALEDGINALQGSQRPDSGAPISVYAMGIDAALFGHNAVYWYAIPSTLQAGGTPTGWSGYANWDCDYTLEDIPSYAASGAVDLDNVYPVVVGDQVVLVDGDSGSVFPTTVASAQVLTRTGYLMSAKVTSITLTATPNACDFGLRTTRVLVQTAQLPVADVPFCDPVAAGPLMLDGAYLSLAVGQLVALTGVRNDKQGETDSEVVAISGLSLVDGYTTVTFTPELTGTYVRSTVTLDANVAPATHGVTTTEILGSGNASQTFQRFPLQQSPLTYVSATTPSGSTSTLVVRVNGVAWTEVDWLYGSGPADQVYTVLAGADGKTYVQLGDGVTGALPGSGTNNIQATYRYGTGSAGLARAGQISTLLSRPLGLKAVTNPLVASGAADPETIDQARPNAPSSVMTIDRIVSLEDVGDFAAATAGIAKAAVNWIWDGSRYVACVTVAGPGGAAVATGTAQYTNLLAAMAGASDGTLPVTLCSYVPVTFTVAATITPDPTLISTDVLAAVKTALATTFSFASRAFGQPVFSSEVIATVQNVPGVVAMTLDSFGFSGTAGAAPLDPLPASAPTLGVQGLVGAQLLTLQPGPLPNVVLAS